jgi:hypothetical protein
MLILWACGNGRLTGDNALDTQTKYRKKLDQHKHPPSHRVATMVTTFYSRRARGSMCALARRDKTDCDSQHRIRHKMTAPLFRAKLLTTSSSFLANSISRDMEYRRQCDSPSMMANRTVFYVAEPSSRYIFSVHATKILQNGPALPPYLFQLLSSRSHCCAAGSAEGLSARCLLQHFTFGHTQQPNNDAQPYLARLPS